MTNEAVDRERNRILWKSDRAQVHIKAYLRFLGLLFCNALVYPSLEVIHSILPDYWSKTVPLSVVQGVGVSLLAAQFFFVITIGALHGAPLRFRFPCSLLANVLIGISALLGSSLSPSQESSVFSWTETIMFSVGLLFL